MDEDLEDTILPIGMLLAGPIIAVQEAQIECERQVIEFILDYGLEEYSIKIGNQNQSGLRLKTLDFEMDRSIPDASNPGNSVIHKVNIKAPLLSIMRLPALSVDEASIDLTLDIETSLNEPNTDKNDIKKSAKKNIFLERKMLPLRLKGSIASRASSKSFRNKGKMNFSLKLKSAEEDEAYGRLIRFISEGLNATINLDDKK
ncbi:MAG: hypothetical protein ACI8R9_000956 [Paraglaciecola sp.]|jgi:hypothetical protein